MATINADTLEKILNDKRIGKQTFKKFLQRLQVINKGLEEEFGGTIEMECLGSSDVIRLDYKWNSDMFKINPHYTRDRWTKKECYQDLFESIANIVSSDVSSKIRIEIKDDEEEINHA